MALTRHDVWRTEDVGNKSTIAHFAQDGATIWATALCRVVPGAGAGQSGGVAPFTGTQTDRLAGWALGANDALDGTALKGTAGRDGPTVAISNDFIAYVSVTALNDDDRDFGLPVYATDDNTYTLTDPTSGIVLGRVVSRRDRESGKAWVHFKVPA